MRSFIVLLLVLFPLINTCTKDNDPLMQIRMIAWDYLTVHQKSTVIVSWKEAPVEVTTYNNISVYAVRFNTSDDPILGPIIVYVDKSSKLVLGQGLRM